MNTTTGTSMNNTHLPRLFAQALNEKQVELFNEFLHPEAL
jgi:hypothetical protein